MWCSAWFKLCIWGSKNMIATGYQLGFLPSMSMQLYIYIYRCSTLRQHTSVDGHKQFVAARMHEMFNLLECMCAGVEICMASEWNYVIRSVTYIHVYIFRIRTHPQLENFQHRFVCVCVCVCVTSSSPVVCRGGVNFLSN